MKKKERIFTFKTDAALGSLLDRMPNRSAFVREAVESALRASCPLCQGTGILTEEQRGHWNHFLQQHSLEHCESCHALHLVCRESEAGRKLH